MLEPAPALFRNVDFLTPNDTETLTLLGGPSLSLDGDSDVDPAAAEILALGPRAEVLKFADAAAALSVMRAGARAAIPSRRQVNQFPSEVAA